MLQLLGNFKSSVFLEILCSGSQAVRQEAATLSCAGAIPAHCFFILQSNIKCAGIITITGAIHFKICLF